MDCNKITADLVFVASSIHSIDVKTNRICIQDETSRQFGIDLKYSQPLLQEDGKYAKLLLQVDVLVGKEDEGVKQDSFRVIIEGLFKVSPEYDDAAFLELLNINGGAALYSIARSKIEVLSGITYVEGKIVLPMINMMQYFAEQAKAQQDQVS